MLDLTLRFLMMKGGTDDTSLGFIRPGTGFKARLSGKDEDCEAFKMAIDSGRVPMLLAYLNDGDVQAKIEKPHQSAPNRFKCVNTGLGWVSESAGSRSEQYRLSAAFNDEDTEACLVFSNSETNAATYIIHVEDGIVETRYDNDDCDDNGDQCCIQYVIPRKRADSLIADEYPYEYDIVKVLHGVGMIECLSALTDAGFVCAIHKG